MGHFICHPDGLDCPPMVAMTTMIITNSPWCSIAPIRKTRLLIFMLSSVGHNKTNLQKHLEFSSQTSIQKELRDKFSHALFLMSFDWLP